MFGWLTRWLRDDEGNAPTPRPGGSKLRLEAQRLGAPARTLKSLEAHGDTTRPQRSAQAVPNLPLSRPNTSRAWPPRSDAVETR